jgi:serine/threonine-protein kinase
MPTLHEQLTVCELLTAEQLEELAALPEAKEADPRVLGKVILQRGWLTRFQISLAAAGKGKDLFLGSYVLLDRLGEGGMGQVFKARHRHMNRLVALKLVRKEKLASADSVRRFYQEVQAAAALVHPNIALAFDAGQAGASHFFSMEYVDGPDLTRLIKEGGVLPVEQACEYIRQVALGLQHAHEKGLVHRDIKPSNLLVASPEGGQPVVKILDLGLARLGDSFQKDRNLTKMGQVIGTPDYLAPEQALDARNVDIRADIYSLGCTLYFLLAGRAPFQAEALTELLMKHQMEATPSVRSIRPDVPENLDVFLQHMMAKKPDNRPDTPAEVAEALAPFARGEEGSVRQRVAVTVPAKPSKHGDTWAGLTEDGEGLITRPPVKRERERSRDDTQDERPRKQAKKPAENNYLPLLIGGGIGAGVLLIAMVIGLIFLLRPGASPSPQAGVTETDKGKTEDKDKGTDKGNGDKDKGDKDKGIPIKPPEQHAVVREGAHARFSGHAVRTTALAVSADGRQAASADAEGVVVLWNLASLEAGKRLGKLTGEVSSLAFTSGDGHLLAAAGNKLHEWDLASGNKTGKEGRPGTWLVPGKQMALTVERSEGKPSLRFWDTRTGEARGSVAIKDATVQNVAFNQAGTVAYVLGDTTLEVVGVDEQRLNWRVVSTAELSVKAACGQSILEAIIGTDPGTISLRTRTADPKKMLRFFHRVGRPVTALALSTDAARILMGNDNGAVTLVDGATGKPLGKFVGNNKAVRRLCFCPDGKHALSAGEDGAVWFWDLDKALPPTPTTPIDPVTPIEPVAGLPPVLDKVAGQVSGFRLANDALPTLAFVKGNEEVLVRSISAASLIQLSPARVLRRYVTAGPSRVLSHGTVSADRKTLAVLTDATTVQLYDVESGKAGLRFEHPSRISCLAFSPDGRYLACGSSSFLYKDGQPQLKDGKQLRGDYGVRVWDLTLRKQDHHYNDVSEGVQHVAFSGDGKLLLASCIVVNPLLAWDVKTREAPPTFRKPLVSGYHYLAPVGKTQVLLGGINGKIHLLDLETWKILKSFTEHSTFIHSLAVLPGDKQFVSTSGFSQNRLTGEGPRDCTLRLWDIDKGIEVGRSTYPAAVRKVTVSSDGTHALTADDTGAIRLIDLRKLQGPDAVVVRPDPPKEKKPFTGHKGKVTCIAISRDGKHLATGGEDGMVRLWDAATGEQRETFTNVARVAAVRFSLDGRYIDTVGEGGIGRIWNIDKRLQEDFLAYPDKTSGTCLDFSPDRKTSVLGAGNQLITRRKVREGFTDVGPTRFAFDVLAVVSLGDATTFAVGDAAGQVHLWNAATKKIIGTRKNHTKAAVLGLAFHPKTNLLVSVGADKAIVTRNVKQWVKFNRVVGHEAPVTSVDVSRDGKHIVTGSKDGTVRVWTRDLKEVHKFEADGQVLGVAFAPDGKRIAWCGKNVRVETLPAAKP